jgi:hypothetical protein
MVTRRTIGIAAAILCLTPLVPAWAQAPDVTGTWTGVLVAGDTKLRVRLNLAADGAVMLDSLDQGAAVPGTAVSMTPDRIEFETPDVGGRFLGKLVSPDRIEGAWSQGGSDLPLTMLRGEAGLNDGLTASGR